MQKSSLPCLKDEVNLYNAQRCKQVPTNPKYPLFAKFSYWKKKKKIVLNCPSLDNFPIKKKKKKTEKQDTLIYSKHVQTMCMIYINIYHKT